MLSAPSMTCPHSKNTVRLLSRIMVLFAMLIAFTPCGANAQRLEKAIITYDNNGGIAYGGYRLELYASGKYAMLVYDDAGQRSPSTGKYERSEGSMTLTDSKGERYFYRIALYQGGEYLLSDDQFKLFSKDKDPKFLYGAMKRTD